MLLVLVPVNYVSTRHKVVATEEKVVEVNERVDGRPKTAVPNVPREVRGLTKMVVKCVMRVKIVRAVWMLFVVKIVRLVSVKVTKDKLRASNAALVNSTMLLVLVPVNYVSTRLTLVKKEETVVALSVQLGGRPKKTAVPNAKLVVQEDLVVLLVETAKIAEQVNTVDPKIAPTNV
jgi:hypothetical protein